MWKFTKWFQYRNTIYITHYTRANTSYTTTDLTGTGTYITVSEFIPDANTTTITDFTIEAVSFTTSHLYGAISLLKAVFFLELIIVSFRIHDCLQ